MKIEDSALAKVFVGQVRSSLKCERCNIESNTFDPFWELSVSIPRVRVSVRRELDSYWHSLYCIDSSLTSYKHTRTNYLYVLKLFECVYFGMFPCAEKSLTFSRVIKLQTKILQRLLLLLTYYNPTYYSAYSSYSSLSTVSLSTACPSGGVLSSVHQHRRLTW